VGVVSAAPREDRAQVSGGALFGWSVVVTRPAHQSGALANALQDHGAHVVAIPTITIEAPTDGGAQLRAAARRLSSFDWIVFTSENAVERFAREVDDASSFAAVRVAAIGEGTAHALAARDVAVELVPERFVAESLVEAFPAAKGRGTVLLPRAAVARDVLSDGLRALGWEVEIVTAYETQPARLAPDAIARVRRADAITFTSSSTVSGFLSNASAADLPGVVASIGPVTSATAREAGIEVAVEAAVHSSAGLADALVDFAARHGRGDHEVLKGTS
jgi:uroporphyrinogen-III synthase